MPIKNNPLTPFIKGDFLKSPLEKGDSGGCLVCYDTLYVVRVVYPPLAGVRGWISPAQADHKELRRDTSTSLSMTSFRAESRNQLNDRRYFFQRDKLLLFRQIF